MQQDPDIRSGERAVAVETAADAVLRYIGVIHTPWTRRGDCPRQGRQDGLECRIEVFEPWVAALDGVEAYETLEILYWLDRSRRDLVLQNPRHDDEVFGTFALRSPVRPNPIGTVMVRLVAREGAVLRVRGLDCLDRTPLIDIKPDRCAYSPKAPPQPGDADGG